MGVSAGNAAGSSMYTFSMPLINFKSDRFPLIPTLPKYRSYHPGRQLLSLQKRKNTNMRKSQSKNRKVLLSQCWHWLHHLPQCKLLSVFLKRAHLVFNIRLQPSLRLPGHFRLPWLPPLDLLLYSAGLNLRSVSPSRLFCVFWYNFLKIQMKQAVSIAPRLVLPVEITAPTTPRPTTKVDP